MGRHDNKSSGNGHDKLDINKTKDVRESGSGRHSDEDRGEQGRQDEQGNQE